jgi:hypothetical protein
MGDGCPKRIDSSHRRRLRCREYAPELMRSAGPKSFHHRFGSLRGHRRIVWEKVSTIGCQYSGGFYASLKASSEKAEFARDCFIVEFSARVQSFFSKRVPQNRKNDVPTETREPSYRKANGFLWSFLLVHCTQPLSTLHPATTPA